MADYGRNSKDRPVTLGDQSRNSIFDRSGDQGVVEPEVPTPTNSDGSEGGSAPFAVAEAGSDLSFARPNADVVYWKFNAGTVIGDQGANVVNGQTGDIFFVPAEVEE